MAFMLRGYIMERRLKRLGTDMALEQFSRMSVQSSGEWVIYILLCLNLPNSAI